MHHFSADSWWGCKTLSYQLVNPHPDLQNRAQHRRKATDYRECVTDIRFWKKKTYWVAIRCNLFSIFFSSLPIFVVTVLLKYSFIVLGGYFYILVLKFSWFSKAGNTVVYLAITMILFHIWLSPSHNSQIEGLKGAVSRSLATL